MTASWIVQLISVLAAVGLTGARSAGLEMTYEPLAGLTAARGASTAGWRPMAGSEAVSLVNIKGRTGFRMPCNFRGTDMDRASWDHAITQDLSMGHGLQFLFYCPDASPVSGFTVYLHSQAGWYRAVFDVPAQDQWAVVRISKADMHLEGQPGGWSKIDTIRVSAWRGKDQDTDFYVADFCLLREESRMIIIANDSAAQSAPGEMNAVREYSNVMSGLLERMNLACLVLSDLDVTTERLRQAELVILPHNPAMPAEVTQALGDFIRQGGKLLAAYQLPNSLASLLNIQVGAHMRQPENGHFASIRPGIRPLTGTPPVTQQASWNIRRASALNRQARVAAWWYTNQGQSTGEPAVIASDQGVFLTHVLLADDAANKQMLLLSMLGHLVPALWADAAQGCVDQIGRFGSYEDYAGAYRAIAGLDTGNAQASEALSAADRLRSEALGLLSEDKFPEAITAAGEARQALIDAFAYAQHPLPGEHRAVWCHSAFGVTGMTWNEAIASLAQHGFTAVLPNMLWGGVAFYRSEVLPVAAAVDMQGDQIELCVAACRQYGIQCHVWKVNFNMGGATDQGFVDQMRSQGRAQMDFDGTVQERWLCPSHPDNQRLEIESMVEVARKYAVDGLHFDYIRYPGRHACFCAGCRTRFERSTGVVVQHWPSDVREDPILAEKWLDFRREQITSVVAAVSAQARVVRPDIKISAAVFRNWPTDRDTVGQDWKLWCDRGYLDFVCPMDYTASNVTFRQMVEQQRIWAGVVPCYPGIGLSVWDGPVDVVKLIEQINITRELNTRGFTIFNYDLQAVQEALPGLSNGMTSTGQ